VSRELVEKFSKKADLGFHHLLAAKLEAKVAFIANT